jgi:hypothetical protein
MKSVTVVKQQRKPDLRLLGEDVATHSIPTARRNPRRFLRPLHVLLLFIEWVAVMVTNVAETVTNSIKDLTLALESYINADPKPDKPEPGN